MPRTRINCPNCRQPVLAEIDQLFDASQDPTAKQKLLSGAFNQIKCPNCGYQGSVSTPIVYHDTNKELLLTFFPPDVSLPREEQERLIGPLITQIMNHLPQEKRKGYLLRPQTVLTLQGLIERILEADGITREMIQNQQQRLNLIQRLVNATPDTLAEIARQEDKLIDAELFTLLNRLVETSMASGDQESAQRLAGLQQALLPLTTFGKEIQSQAKEVEAAVASLREAGESLTREKLLDLFIHAPNETRQNALASMARPGMDYEFFGLLSDRINQARGEEKPRLEALRERLLEMTRQIDQQVQARSEQSRQLLNGLLQAENIGEATLQVLPAIDEFFLHELDGAMEAARKAGDLDRIGKLQKVVEVIQQASQPPAEVALIEELLDAPDDSARRSILEEKSDQITPEFMDALTNIVAQVQASDDQGLAERVKAVHRLALRFSMERNLKK
jgi:hypothetical protein